MGLKSLGLLGFGFKSLGVLGLRESIGVLVFASKALGLPGLFFLKVLGSRVWGS